MELRGEAAPDVFPAADGASDLGSLLRRAVFGVLAAVILFGPAPGQLFGHHSPALREWKMYSGVGVGILRGSFTLREGERAIAAASPLEALGMQRYPRIRHYLFPNMVFAPEDLAPYAATLCAGAAPGQTVIFDGHVGTRQGWRALAADDLCALPAHAGAGAQEPPRAGAVR
jgi:hypothetical protein